MMEMVGTHGCPVAGDHPSHLPGHKEKGNINTPMELAINNQTDRFSLAIDAIDRVPKLQRIGAHDKESFHDSQIACRGYASEHGINSPEISGWKWPFEKL